MAIKKSSSFNLDNSSQLNTVEFKSLEYLLTVELLTPYFRQISRFLRFSTRMALTMSLNFDISVFMNILPNKSATLRNLKNGISKSIIKEFCSNQWKCGDFSPPVFNFICSNVHKCIAPINRDSAPMEQKIQSYKDKDFSTNGIAGTLDDNYHWLTNEDFNLFRKNTNNGEDFLIFSEVEKQSLSAKIHNK